MIVKYWKNGYQVGRLLLKWWLETFKTLHTKTWKNSHCPSVTALVMTDSPAHQIVPSLVYFSLSRWDVEGFSSLMCSPLGPMGKKTPKETRKKKKRNLWKDKGCSSGEVRKQTLCPLMIWSEKARYQAAAPGYSPCPAYSQRQKTENRKQSLQ